MAHTQEPSTKMMRKRVSLTVDEIDRAREIAEEEGVSLSALFRGWVEGFIALGSSYRAPKTDEVQILVPPEVYEQAEQLAREKYGCSLRDILRHTLSEA